MTVVWTKMTEVGMMRRENIFKIVAARFADWLDIECKWKNEVKDDFRFFDLSN